MSRFELPRPLLKWAGGKTQLLGELLAQLPSHISGTYCEPFVGGGALFFALFREKKINRVRLSDGNPELVDLYTAVRDNVAAVVEALAEHHNDEAHFYEVRSRDRLAMPLAQRAARTIFLNRVGFNGLYRVNQKGTFNVPFGRYTNPTLIDVANLEAVSKSLQNVEIACLDFEAACENLVPGDVVYFDPPYVPVSRSASFSSYAKAPFGDTEHVRLTRVFARLADERVYALLSNSDVPRTRELYAGFQTESVFATRAINSVASKRGQVSELLVRNVRVQRSTQSYD